MTGNEAKPLAATPKKRMKRKKKTAAKTTTTPSPPPSPPSRSLSPRPDPAQQHQDDRSPPTATHDQPSSSFFSTSSLRRRLFSPIDPAGLALFRLFWGLLMFYELFTMLSHDMHKARLLYRSTQLRFQYSTIAFCWEPPLAASLTAMWWLLTLSALCAFLVAVGLCYRFAAAGLLLGLTYFYLLEEATYLNHYYLMLVVQFIMCCVPANATFAVDNLVWPSSKRKTIPSWTLNWLRAEMSLVYFFAGVAKCNEDWLRGQPLRIWLPRRKRLPWPLGAFLASSVGAYVFSIAGLLFDLSIGFLLWPSSSSCPSCSSSCSSTTKSCCRGDDDCRNASWRRKWKVQELAMTVTFIFHLLNKAIFNIGIFPILCLAATTLYLDPSWPRAIADRYGPMRAWRDMKELYRLLMEKEEGEEEKKKREEEARKKEKRTEEEAKRQRRRRGWKRREIVVAVLLLIFFAHQTLVPLRFLLYEGNVAWTEYGHRYSWRMKLRDKQCNATVTLEVDVPLSFFLLSSSSSSDNQTSPFLKVNDNKMQQQKEEKKEGIVRLQAQIPLEQHLNRRQMGNSLSKPSSLIQIARFLSARWTHDHSNEIQQWEKLNHKEGWGERNDLHLIFVPRVYISSMCSLNGRKAQLLVDPLADLASFSPYEAEPYPFVLPLEPLSEEEKQELVWNVVWRWLFSDSSS